MSVLLALDIGAAKISAIALSLDSGNILAARSVVNGAEVSNLPRGHFEQNPLKIKKMCAYVLKTLLESETVNPSDVVAIGLTGQMHGVMLTSRDLTPLSNLITGRDRRTLNNLDDGNLTAAVLQLDSLTPARTGCHLRAGYGGATLYWLSRRGAIPNNALALNAADYICACMCGQAVTDPTHAAGWGLLDIRNNWWDMDSIDRLNIPTDIFPEILQKGAVAGAITREWAEDLGLGTHVVVCAPVGENQAGVVGATIFRDDCAVIKIGSGGQISLPCPAFVFDEGLETRPTPLGGYIQVGTTECAGLAFAYYCKFIREVGRDFFGVSASEESVMKKAAEMIEIASPGAGGLAADTRFKGSTSDPNARGGFYNIDLENMTCANMTRAVAEGIVKELYLAGRRSRSAAYSQIAASGAFIRKNPAVWQIIEDQFGVPCSAAEIGEEAAFGAALTAAVGTKVMTLDQVVMLFGG